MHLALQVSWHGFYDDNEYDIVHPTGIARYELSVGSSYGHNNVYFGDVGLQTSYTLTGLKLADGTTVFANVTGIGYNGLSASSHAARPVTIDTSPPLAGHVSVVQSTGLHANTIIVTTHWFGFSDPHSNIEGYEVAIGSEHGYGEYSAYTSVGHETSFEAEIEIAQGHHFYVTVGAKNYAGLTTYTHSALEVATTTPPSTGFVNDGANAGHDVDYQADKETLWANWGAFNGAAEYEVSVGTSRSGDDVLGWHTVFRATTTALDGMELVDGHTYYIGVRACNMHDLCVVVYSNGVTIDSSPPLVGFVDDGFHPGDARVQASTIGIGGSWFSFADPESGLQYYEWCIGVTINGCELQPFLSVGLATRAVNPAIKMPVNGSAYVTVKAFNHVGLVSVASSNGVLLDTEYPEVVEIPAWVIVGNIRTKEFDSMKGDNHTYQHTPSALRATWKFKDRAGYALSYRYTIDANNDGTTPVAEGRVGMEDGVYLTQLALIDGDRFTLSVTACDEAGLCTTAKSKSNILVDGSPPNVGDLLNSMTWKENQLSLEWTGFSDPHSGVYDYLVSAGTTFGGSDLVKSTVVLPECMFEGSSICNHTLGNHRTYNYTVREQESPKMPFDLLSILPF